MKTVILTDLTDVIARDMVDVMTVAEFVEQVNTGGFVDYDGSGYLMVGPYTETDQEIAPSDIGRVDIPAQYTHVAWYNR